MAPATSDHQRRLPSSSNAILRTCSAVSTRRRRSGRTVPTMTVMAASAHQPFSLHAVSSLTRSPSRTSRWPGMPWTTCSLSEMQVLAGKGVFGVGPGYPLNRGRHRRLGRSRSFARRACTSPGTSATPRKRPCPPRASAPARVPTSARGPSGKWYAARWVRLIRLPRAEGERGYFIWSSGRRAPFQSYRKLPRCRPCLAPRSAARPCGNVRRGRRRNRGRSASVS